MNILITGASGLIGTHLTDFLTKQGHEVAHLGREKSSGNSIRQFVWDPANGTIENGAVAWADAIVHLAGANVAEGRWTEKRKEEIIESRVKGAQLLAATIRKENAKAKVFVSAAAVGFYGMITSEIIFKEIDPPASDFFGMVCLKWENSADLVEETGLRTVKLRIGVVLAKDGGALPKLAGPVKWFAGSPLGSGKQWMPWIHIDDLCALFLKAIEDGRMNGPYNAAASQHVTNKEFVKTIGKVLHRPVFLPPVPKFALKLFLGEMSGIVTEGSRVSNQKLLNAGFHFQHTQLEEALNDLLK
ncbi:MAG: TIGR01777 family oxidoreductase [Bacteroidota bacterium]|nr:TIGR01777 family oxidoreductase [Bacteroidota bacterium]